MQEYYEMPNLCFKIQNMIEVNEVCNISDPVNPPRGDIDKDINNLVHSYARENVAVIKIFVKDPYYTNYKRDIDVTLTTFVGNAGGLMGLCLGLSIISLFEVVYHIIIASLRKFRTVCSKST